MVFSIKYIHSFIQCICPIVGILAATTYVSGLVEHVVGELDFLERDGLLEQLVAGERRVGMGVDARRQRWVGLAGDEPRRPVVGVAVALVVDRHDVHQHGVARVAIQPGEAHAQRRKHPSANK